MFEYLYGRIEHKNLNYITLDINGIGYKVYISIREYENLKIGENYRLFIYNYVKEDDYKLIGFLEEKERKLFEMLLSVKGIGISLALAILSTFSYNIIIELIVSKNISELKKVPKLGEKKAQLIILDLEKKLKNISISTLDNKNISYLLDDLISALESLGYSKKEIDKMIDSSEIEKFTSVEMAIKEILKKIKVG